MSTEDCQTFLNYPPTKNGYGGEKFILLLKKNNSGKNFQWLKVLWNIRSGSFLSLTSNII